MPPEADLIRRLRAGSAVQLRAIGGSMWPSIRDGAVLLIEPRSGRPLRVGEIACAESESRLVMHRIVELHGDVVITRGDTLDNNDPPVANSDVLGVVTVISQRPFTARLPTANEVVYLARALRRRLRRLLRR